MDRNKHLNKEFLKVVLPSMLAFMFSGIYAIVDGFFVGRNVGDNGLAAINMAYPLVAFIQAAGTGIGMGGAVKISLAMGKGNKEEQRTYLSSALWLLAGACVVVTIGLCLWSKPLLELFGAQGTILILAEEYIRIIILGTVFQLFGVGLIPLIRNFDGSVPAMMAMIAGFMTNVILDWLFVSVFQQGLAGAAAATIVGQGVTALCCIICFMKKKLHRFVTCHGIEWRHIGGILVIGLSPFGLTMSPNLVIMVLNKGASVYGGSEAVACYAVISYMVCVVQLLLQGIGDGSQPLLGRYYGAGENDKVLAVRKLSYVYAFITAVCSMIVLYALKWIVPAWFGASVGTVEDVAAALPVFLYGFLFVAFLRVTISYFSVTEKNKHAYALIYGEPVLLTILTALILPRVFGIQGVWLAAPVTQGLLTLLGLYLLKKR